MTLTDDEKIKESLELIQAFEEDLPLAFGKESKPYGTESWEVNIGILWKMEGLINKIKKIFDPKGPDYESADGWTYTPC